MIYIIFGNTGAGKTTYAQTLKQKTKSVIFSIDEWNQTLFLNDKKPGDGVEWFLERIERAENMIKNLVHQLETTKVNAILDLGFAKLDHRQKFRRFAQDNGYEVEMHYLNVATEVRKQRVLKRNQQQGETFQFEVTEQDFMFMEAWFETPDEEELKHIIQIDLELF